MTFSKKTIIALTFFVTVVSLATAFSAHGAVTTTCSMVDGKEVCALGNPLKAANDIPSLICLVVVILAKNLMPPVVVIMILWASFLFLTAAGQPGKIVQARTTLVWAIIGTVILLLSVPLVNLVATAIGGTTPNQCSGSGTTSSIFDIAAALINWFAWLLGMLSVVMGLYSGFLYMTSRGEPQKVATAGKIIFYAIIGILVAIISFSLLSIVKTFLGV